MKFRDQLLEFTMELPRFGDDFARLSRFARIFVEEAPVRIDVIAHALRARDGELLRQGAEGLKDALDALGAPEAAAIAEDVARCGRAGDFARAKMLVIALRRDVNDLVAGVKRWPPLVAAERAEKSA